RGLVVDDAGEPLIGVSVVVDGTTNGTITDYDGNFTLSCSQGDNLQISYVGYKSQNVKATANMKVVLQEDAQVLADFEVVAVGYGSIRKSDLTGAITSVSSDNMKKGMVTSSEQLLQGRVAGLTVVQGSGDPTKGSSLRLRGGSSLSGENAPLVVVDGIANVDMNTVQPSDIVSVDILKDASAAAIYGSRGANGVIIVTTNRKDTESSSASYAGYVGVGQAANKLKLANASDWIADSRNDYGANTDWQDEITRTAISHSHALTFNNSSKKGGFKGSMSYLNSEGVVKTSDLERMAASVSGYTTAWNERLLLESGVHTNSDNFASFDYQSIFYNAYNQNPTLPVMENGAYAQSDLVPAAFNPIEIMNKNKSKQSTLRLMAFGKAELQIINGLKGTVNLSYNGNNGRNKEYKYRDSRLYNLYNGHATQTYSNYNEKQLETFFNYDKTFNKLHNLNLMSGYSYSKTFSDGFGGAKHNFTSDDWLYNNLAAATETQYMYSYKNTTALASFFGRANYSYAGKYMFTATVRRDGSSKFGANNKWGTFPSGSFAWRVSDESFMDNTSEWLRNLKLRAGYGVTGNQGGITPYNSLMTMAPNSSGTVTSYVDDEGVEHEFVSLVFERNPNENLKWESTGQLNVGLDFTLWDRIDGSVEYYNKKTWDLLYYYEVGSDYPVQSMLLNIGDLKNSGVEVNLNTTIIKTDDFNWSADLNFAHNKNEVVKLTDERFANTEFWGGQLKHGASSY
ncbi:MAG: SusC/RagA family TonB-linked outer membrane protein, partial [Clostridiaceae bacterium]|nr:SusC/RagA family TonB-linked outer membrane protein [Clostridiaceae bacterium]